MRGGTTRLEAGLLGPELRAGLRAGAELRARTGLAAPRPAWRPEGLPGAAPPPLRRRARRRGLSAAFELGRLEFLGEVTC